MKKVTKAICLLTLTAILSISNPPAFAQASGESFNSETNREADDDNGNWGLLGLLGLAGLIGLKRRDDDRPRTTASASNLR